jgi:pimeloyl-ACP methyl ester carboxylesterase
MDSLGIERFAIAGVSYGGAVAFRYAATRIERIDALILINSAGVEPGKQAVDPKTRAKMFYSTISSNAPVTRDYVANALAHSFNNPALVTPDMIQRKLDAMNVIDRDREGATMVAQYVRGNPERVLAHVRAPTLVLWGAAERSLSPATADRVAAALIHARPVRKVMIPGGDHAMHIEMAQATAQVAKDFLDYSLTGQH